MIMPTTGKRKTTRAQRTLFGTGRFDLKISTVVGRQLSSGDYTASALKEGRHDGQYVHWEGTYSMR
jgi:hypothetical protein